MQYLLWGIPYGCRTRCRSGCRCRWITASLHATMSCRWTLSSQVISNHLIYTVGPLCSHCAVVGQVTYFDMVGACFIVSSKGKFGLNGGAPGCSCMMVPSSSLLAGILARMPLSIVLTVFNVSPPPLIYLLFLIIFNHPAWSDPLGWPSPGA